MPLSTEHQATCKYSQQRVLCEIPNDCVNRSPSWISTKDFPANICSEIPILRKDFIIDEYQILEARSMGADVILLIAACLTPERVKELATFAKSLQLEVLLEIHSDEELQHICDETELVGVNNRDLKTFIVDINRSIELSKKIPDNKIKIAESGINDIETIRIFRKAGFKGFLIGENFMKQPDPTIAFVNFVEQLNAKET
jgi:indole-3-glycerol phosphate synthase